MIIEVMTEKNLTRLAKLLGNSLRKKELFLYAITHPSYQSNGDQSRRPGERLEFQRLEFLGDSVLNYFVARELYERFPEATEGDLSKLRSILVSRRLLARIGKKLKLGTMVVIDDLMVKNSPRLQEKILADSFEALLGALYLSRGLTACKKFLKQHFESYFNPKKLFELDPNPKSTLQEYAQKKWHVLPLYSTHDNAKGGFLAYVAVRGKMKTKGEGETKQEAETQAALKLLKRLKVIKS